MKQVIRTTVLSKRWRLLWTSTHTLIFNYSGQSNHGIRKFLSFVDDTLLLCQPSKVKKFSVDFDYNRLLSGHVNKWMRFIKNKFVEELDLYLRGQGLNELYSLPQHMYSNVWLQELSLCNCILVPMGKISWPALKVLAIKYAELNQEVIKKICSGCPALESLKFSVCCGVDCYNIDSKSVKKLVIDGYWQRDNEEEEEEDVEELEIHARNITSLEIRGYFHKRIVVLDHVQALVDAKLDFYRKTDDYDDENDSRTDKTMLRDLLVSLKHVEKLSIGSWCLQVLAILAKRNLSCPMMRCKYLTLNSQMRKWELPGIGTLLQSCPHVEILNFNMEYPFKEFHYGSDFEESNDFNEEDYWISRPCWVLHLKTLRIKGFWRCVNYHKDIFGFLQVVLKNAVMLEKIIIDSFEDGTQFPLADYRRVTEMLLSFPRSSRDAVILFSR